MVKKTIVQETKDLSFPPKTEIRIEAPASGLSGFRIRYKEPGGNWTNVVTPEIQIANKLYLSGVQDADRTKAQLDLVREALYRRREDAPTLQMVTANQKLAEMVYAEKYPRSARLKMAEPDGPIYDMMQVVKACGPDYPLSTCDLDELAEHFHDTFEERISKHYRIITWTNVMLRHLGRKQLKQIDPERPEVRYLTEKEFEKQLLLRVKHDNDRLLFRIAFYTGLRKSELYYIQHKHIREHTLWVEGQMLEGGKMVKRLKRGTKPHDAILPACVREDVEKWCDVSMEDRISMRYRKHAKILKNLCRKEWPKNTSKHLVFHDLRHSNAIWILENTDLTLHEVAQHLGNTSGVVEKYYSGYQLKKGSIDRAAKLLDNREKDW